MWPFHKDKAEEKKPALPLTGRERALRILSGSLTLLVIALQCTYLTEVVARRARSSALAWANSRPLLFLAETAVFFACAVFFIFLSGRPRRGVRLVTVPALVLSAINLYKMDLRGEPLLMTDFAQAREALMVMPHFRLTPHRYLIVAIVLLGVLLPRLFERTRLPITAAGRRAAAAVSGLAAAAVLVIAMSTPLYIPQQTDLLYEEAGWVRALWETRPKNLLKQPDNYSEEAVLSALAGSGAEPLAGDTVLPDVFFIMSESMFDLNRLGVLEMSADPLEGIKALQERFAGADYIAPHLGGGTFYSEYEVLTGYRAEDTPGALFSDRSATADGMVTLATVLKDAGYATTVMHPNTSRFYSRGFNYRRFGFDRQLFTDTGLPAITEKVGPYPKDSGLFRLLLEDYGARDETSPYFAFVITYQNHGDYKYEYDRRDILVTDREGTQKRSGENYLNALLEHAEAVESLLEELSRRERPCVVVLWGDHAPGIGDFGLDFGRGSEATPYYRTPLLIWNNYGADFAVGEEAVAAYRLGAIVLSRLGIRTDAYFNLLADLVPDLVESQRMVEEDGSVFRDDVRYDALDDTLLLLHYDRLKGEGYWKGAVK